MTCSGSQWNICLHLSSNFQTHCIISHWLNCTRSQTEKGSCRDHSDNPVSQSTKQNGCRHVEHRSGMAEHMQHSYHLNHLFLSVCVRERKRDRGIFNIFLESNKKASIFSFLLLSPSQLSKIKYFSSLILLAKMKEGINIRRVTLPAGVSAKISIARTAMN